MAESIVEQLDQAVTALLANSEAALGLRADVEPFVRIASELRDLPRSDFRDRLKEDLERIANMTTSKAASAADLRSEISDLKSQISDQKTSKPAREGFHTITPYLAVKEAPQLIEFVKEADGEEPKVGGIVSAALERLFDADAAFPKWRETKRSRARLGGNGTNSTAPVIAAGANGAGSSKAARAGEV